MKQHRKDCIHAINNTEYISSLSTINEEVVFNLENVITYLIMLMRRLISMVDIENTRLVKSCQHNMILNGSNCQNIS